MKKVLTATRSSIAALVVVQLLFGAVSALALVEIVAGTTLLSEDIAWHGFASGGDSVTIFGP